MTRKSERLPGAVEAEVEKPENAVVEVDSEPESEDAKELVNQEKAEVEAKPEENQVESA